MSYYPQVRKSCLTITVISEATSWKTGFSVSGELYTPVANRHTHKTNSLVLAINEKGCCRNGRNQARAGIMRELMPDPCFADSPLDYWPLL
ncbi:hypothetical protein [Synechococcus sp. MIT S9507]|uniref:hypothetical protein n=1 Tax=Synechococcus sp. MIT S9507 TaxID=3082544 RepID=UPI0039B5CDDE